MTLRYYLHLITQLTKLLEIGTKKSPREIVRLTVEWFLSQENNG